MAHQHPPISLNSKLRHGSILYHYLVQTPCMPSIDLVLRQWIACEAFNEYEIWCDRQWGLLLLLLLLLSYKE